MGKLATAMSSADPSNNYKYLPHPKGTPDVTVSMPGTLMFGAMGKYIYPGTLPYKKQHSDTRHRSTPL